MAPQIMTVEEEQGLPAVDPAEPKQVAGEFGMKRFRK